VITLLQEWGLPVRQRTVSLAEVIDAHEKGDLLEVFGSGTAAVISSVGELATAHRKIVPGDGKAGELTQRLYSEITAIHYGEKPDTHGWCEEI
jgi:branched-chain amino acid aminotransferase